MAVRFVHTFRFRNLRDSRVELDDKLNVISGPNASGKTNLLEAVYFGARCSSFRTSNLSELAKKGFDSCRVVLELSGEKATTLEVEIEKGRTKAAVDRKPVRSRTELLDVVKVLSFCPEDLKMVKGEPSTRRNFVDRMGSFIERGIVDLLRDYNRVLRQRNHLLKNWKEIADEASLDVFTEQLVSKGLELHRARKRVVELVQRDVTNMYAVLSSGQRKLGLRIASGFPPFVQEDEKSLLRWFKGVRKRETDRGTTAAGPHKGDVIIELDSMDARKFASQGEQRCCALAFLLGVVDRYKQRSGSGYTLLLDDLSSELDARRRERLFELLFRLGGQIVVTTAEPSVVAGLPQKPSIHYRMDCGRTEVMG